MRKGLVRITPQVIREALQFPPGWEIENMKTTIEHGRPIIEAVISGSEFPEAPESEGVPIKECEIIFHKEYVRLEVKEIC